MLSAGLTDLWYVLRSGSRQRHVLVNGCFDIRPSETPVPLSTSFQTYVKTIRNSRSTGLLLFGSPDFEMRCLLRGTIWTCITLKFATKCTLPKPDERDIV